MLYGEVVYRYVNALCRNNIGVLNVNPLNTKRRLLYLKTRFVPRSKQF